MVNIGNDWDELLKDEFEKEYYKKLREFLKDEYQNNIVYPHMDEIFSAFKYTSYSNTKVVILGQDPYHGKDQAHGLSFSVRKHIKIPPSLKNIYKELQDDLGCYIPNNGDLSKWAKQGVLLLNTSLTVRAAEANSHRNKGWEKLTDKVIELLNQKTEPVVFVLWGSNAISKEKLIDTEKHFVIKSVHPSPLSANRGFFGSKPFSKTNEILKSIGQGEIDWQIENV